VQYLQNSATDDVAVRAWLICWSMLLVALEVEFFTWQEKDTTVTTYESCFIQLTMNFAVWLLKPAREA